MRRGEILSLRWTQIKGMHVDGSTVTWAPRAEFVLPWTKTKTRRDRSIPISSRLKVILTLRGFDPAGQPMPATSYVFGNEIGQRVKSVSRAWNRAVLKAHGYEPSYTQAMNLTVTSRAALGLVDLHFHDLRREAGSRWLEGGVPLHTVRDWLGYTSIAQTSTYLASTMKTQHDHRTLLRHAEGDRPCGPLSQHRHARAVTRGMPATLQSRRMPQLFSAWRLLERYTVMKSALVDRHI